MLFRFKKFNVETGMLKVLREIGALFEELLFDSVFMGFLNNVFREW